MTKHALSMSHGEELQTAGDQIVDLQRELIEARATIAMLQQASTVSDRPGRPVAAPCAIDGCQFDRAETAEAHLRTVVEALKKYAKIFGHLPECEMVIGRGYNEPADACTCELSAAVWLAEESAKERP